tara:strand:- start:42 stop:653 length:612 start_codon:yes stop_codon:yes gene_type:complete
MGGPSSGGASGSDAGFENTQKSKLSKKNQKLVDTNFDKRGAEKIDQLKVLPPSVFLFKGAFKKGSEVTRNFFTDKVLTSEKGMKNFGTTKEEFAKMSVSQQESIYKDYTKSRMSGATDAYGNPIGKGSADNSKSIVQPKVASQMDNTGVKSNLITADKTSPTKVEMSEDQNMIDIKRRGRKTTMLTDLNESKKPTLSKKVLLG